MGFFTDIWTLLHRKSRTIWSAVGTGFMIFADQFTEVKTLLMQIGVQPYWLALGGLAIIIYARRDDFNKEKNPQ